MDDVTIYVFISVAIVMFLAVVIMTPFNIRKYGGMKGIVFGAKISDTVGEIQGVGSNSLAAVYIRVRRLSDGNVGLELTQKSMLGYQMNGVRLTVDECERLRGQLHAAVEAASEKGG